MEENEVTVEDAARTNKQDSTDSNESNDSAKRLKTDDSGIYVDTGASSDEVKMEENVAKPSTSFPKASHSKTRNYRKTKTDSDSEEVATSQEEVSNSNAPREGEPQVTEDSESESSARAKPRLVCIMDLGGSDSVLSNEEPPEAADNDDDEDDHLSFFDSDTDTSVNIEDPPVLTKEKPKHKWFMVPEIMNRQIGTSSKYKSSELFQQRCYGSLHSVQRLELMYKLEKHEGCVNSLNFHPNGSYLASGSDDLTCVIWDWPVGKPLLAFDTKHRTNVFQSKFLPFSGDLHVVTCARDGQVRLHQVSQTEGLRHSRRLGGHKGPTHKLALLRDQPHIVLSAGEDGCVISHDIRVNKSSKILTVQGLDERKIALYSINSNPLNSHHFCVSGRDHIVRIYDQRKLQTPVNTFLPGHVKKKSEIMGLHVTCAVYNYNGTEILASYNDDDIYLFDANANTNSYVHSYQGHRNGATIKGVSFFGPKSEYIVSGSDCGNVYFWDKNTEAIVQCMLADDNGVVNCLEPHPQLPIICTSGLDWDVKVWVPSHEHEPEMPDLAQTVRRNHRSRINDRIHSSNDINDSQMLWMLWRHLRTSERSHRRRRQAEAPAADSSPSNDPELTVSEDSTSSNPDSSDEDDIVRPITCSPS